MSLTPVHSRSRMDRVSANASAPAAVTAKTRREVTSAGRPGTKTPALRLEPVQRRINGADRHLASRHSLELAAHVHPVGVVPVRTTASITCSSSEPSRTASGVVSSHRIAAIPQHDRRIRQAGAARRHERGHHPDREKHRDRAGNRKRIGRPTP